MKRLGVIPCRYGSSRFPGKPLANILGRPMIEHTYRSATKSNMLQKVYVASDCDKILSVASSFGAPTIKTSMDCKTGTDRVNEAVKYLIASDEIAPNAIIVNVQGDEPLIRPDHIDIAIRLLELDEGASMSTIAVSEKDEKSFINPNIVKVVKDRFDNALYFSRSPIPYHRRADKYNGGEKSFLKHIGLYAFRCEFIQRYPCLPASDLEIQESLEQLRVLEAGERIKVGIVNGPCYPGVDTPEDLELLIKMMKTEKIET